MDSHGPVLRVFEVRAKPGCAGKLLENFATTSADVVRSEPGNEGYFFGHCLEGDEDTALFVSAWRDLAAVKARFGEAWQEAYLPEGYEDLIEACSLRHFDMSGGWHLSER